MRDAGIRSLRQVQPGGVKRQGVARGSSEVAGCEGVHVKGVERWGAMVGVPEPPALVLRACSTVQHWYCTFGLLQGHKRLPHAAEGLMRTSSLHNTVQRMAHSNAGSKAVSTLRMKRQSLPLAPTGPTPHSNVARSGHSRRCRWAWCRAGATRRSARPGTSTPKRTCRINIGCVPRTRGVVGWVFQAWPTAAGRSELVHAGLWLPGVAQGSGCQQSGTA